MTAPGEHSSYWSITREQRERYRTPRVGRLVIDLTLVWFQAIAGCAIFVLHPSAWTYVLAVSVIGGAQHGFLMVSHECVHRLVRPRNRKLNDWIGAHLFSAPALQPYFIYRERHRAHHRFVSTAKDTKSVYRRNLAGWRFLLEAVRSLSTADYVGAVFNAVRVGRRAEGRDTAAFSPMLWRDGCRVLLVQTAIAVAFLPFGPLWYGVPLYYVILWLIPALTTMSWFGKLRSAVEHQPLGSETHGGSESPYFMGTPAPMLRSVRATRLERLFLSKLNFHFHGEHHLWPWISYQYLPEASESLWQGASGTMRVQDESVHMSDGYLVVLRQFVRGY